MDERLRELASFTFGGKPNYIWAKTEGAGSSQSSAYHAWVPDGQVFHPVCTGAISERPSVGRTRKGANHRCCFFCQKGLFDAGLLGAIVLKNLPRPQVGQAH